MGGTLPYPSGRVVQVLLPWSAEGGVAKLDSNKPAITAAGDWLIAFWREQGGSPACEQDPEMHGVPGVLLSSDQVSSNVLLSSQASVEGPSLESHGQARVSIVKP